VVAGEVRSLASRSAEAAKEIKSLITDSVEKVETGTNLVDEAGQSMQSIVEQVQRVSTLIHEISNASAEQSRGIGQMGEAVNQLDQVTQQNAALVEQSAAAADSLRSQAELLAKVVSVFKLANAGGDFAAPPIRSKPMPAPAVVRKVPAPTVKTSTHKLGKAPAPTIAKAPTAPVTSHLPAATTAAGDDWETF